MPSGPVSTTPFSICRFRPATRTMKNSSMFEPTNDRNISRSSSGLDAILRFLQHAALKIEQAQLAIDVETPDRSRFARRACRLIRRRRCRTRLPGPACAGTSTGILFAVLAIVLWEELVSSPYSMASRRRCPPIPCDFRAFTEF